MFSNFVTISNKKPAIRDKFATCYMIHDTKKQFLMGSKVVVKAALRAGAEAFFGYPITPTTEILEFWAEEALNNKKLLFLQTEDEMAAGFAVIGAVLSGKKTFTATAGPGNVLIQDAFGMAEAMRIPIVAIIGQRGGPSTGTVIYSQQEVTLTCFGGHGEGLRIVYSPSSSDELFRLVIKAFNSAWQYRFPAFILTDGYLLKMKEEVIFEKPKKIIKSSPILPKKGFVNLRNCYSFEEELYEVLEKNEKDYQKLAPKIEEYEIFGSKNPEILVFAHGIIASSVKEAISSLPKSMKVALFRPITLRPFPQKEASKAVRVAKKILFVESSFGQLARLVKDNLFGLKIGYDTLFSPALGITPEEIADKIKRIYK